MESSAHVKAPIGVRLISMLFLKSQANGLAKEHDMSDETPAVASPSLYKYVTRDVLKKILNGSVRFTQPTAFNDPFELLPEFVIPANATEEKVSIAFDILAQRRHPPVGDIDIVPEGSLSSDPTARDIVKDLNETIGILCLAQARDSLLMWSHYAEQYCGAVIEFDASHPFFANQIEVEYRSSRPRKDFQAFLQAPVPLAELCTKSDQWRYEGEVRIVRLLSDCHSVGVDPRGFPVFVQAMPMEAVKSVTMGERMSVPDQREIYELIKDTDVGLLLAAIEHSGFTFRHERVKFNVPASRMQPMMSPRTAHIFNDGKSVRGEFAKWMVEKHPWSKIVNKPV
jgi:hypothetical protein